MSYETMRLDMIIYGTAYMKCYVDPKTDEAITEHIPMKDIYKDIKTLNDLVVDTAKFLPSGESDEK